MPAQSKIDMLEKVNAALDASDGVYVIDYQGLSVKESLSRFLQGVKAHDEVWHKENEKVLPRSPGRGVPFNEPGRNKKH